MASYFDEHDCEPLRDGEQPDHLLHMARYMFLYFKQLEIPQKYDMGPTVEIQTSSETRNIGLGR